MRRLGSITLVQHMLLSVRPWLISCLWNLCIYGCSLMMVLCPSLGSAAEQAELEYAKGVVEYGKGNYLEALEHFRTVVALTPEDPNARFYLGLTQNRLGEFGSAITQLEKTLQLDPSLRYTHYHLGIAYFQEQRFSEALPQFQRAAEFDPQNAAVQFYQGYTLYQMKQYRDALPPFERSIQMDAALVQSAQYYRGVSLFTLENDAQARVAFEAVRAVDATSTIGQNAERYLEALKARERERRWWQVQGGVSFQYDDNVISEPNTISISRQSDGSMVFDIGAKVFPVRQALWDVGAGYDFFQSVHFSLHDFDIRSHAFSLFGRLKVEPVTFRLSTSYALTALDNARFSETLTLQPSATIKQSETFLGLVALQYRPENFSNDVPAGQLAAVRGRDGWNVRVGYDQFWLFNNKRSYARLGYHYDTQRSDGSDWDYNGHEVSLGVQTPLGAGLTLDVNGTYYRFDYQNINSFSCCYQPDTRGLGDLDLANDTQKRTDNRFTAGVALSRDFGPYVTLSAGYVHTSNQSNIPFFDYRRNLVTLAVSGRY